MLSYRLSTVTDFHWEFETSFKLKQTSHFKTKTFTLLLKSKFFNFEILSRVHVYRIEYVSYRQRPYRIRIVSAASRIVPALQSIVSILVEIIDGMTRISDPKSGYLSLYRLIYSDCETQTVTDKT